MSEDKLSLGDHRFALRLRDLITHMITRETRKIHPPDAYASVVSVDYSAGRAGCIFGTSTTAVTRPFGKNCQPSVGSTVRVCGRATNRYIAAVTSGPVWFDLQIANSWSAGVPAPQYMRDVTGIVRLRGQINTGSPGDIAFTLPPDAIPASAGSFMVPADLSSTSILAQLDSSGNFTPTDTGSNVALDSISFDAN